MGVTDATAGVSVVSGGLWLSAGIVDAGASSVLTNARRGRADPETKRACSARKSSRRRASSRSSPASSCCSRSRHSATSSMSCPTGARLQSTCPGGAIILRGGALHLRGQPEAQVWCGRTSYGRKYWTPPGDDADTRAGARCGGTWTVARRHLYCGALRHSFRGVVAGWASQRTSGSVAHLGAIRGQEGCQRGARQTDQRVRGSRRRGGSKLVTRQIT